MIITVDTNKDSQEDIQNAITILNKYLSNNLKDESEILASIPKEVNNHRPSGPGIFDVQEPNVKDDKILERIKDSKETNKKLENLHFSAPVNLIQEDNQESNQESNEENSSQIEYNGGRITRGTAPDFTSYLELLKQKRTKQVSNLVEKQEPIREFN